MLRYRSRDGNTYATNDHFPPISRTLRYKKVTKPLLERKRRARINRCLDELKDLVGVLEADGENINKLEKADILELTVRHLKRISRLQDPVQEAHRFQAGFSQCASEACIFLGSLPGLNSAVGKRLIEHLKQSVLKHRLPAYVAAATPTPTPVEARLGSGGGGGGDRGDVRVCDQLRLSVPNQRFSPPLSPSSAVSTLKPLSSPPMSYHRFVSTPTPGATPSATAALFIAVDTKNQLSSSSPSPSPCSNADDNSMWRPW